MKESAYINDYFYFTVAQDKKDGQDVLICRSGVNLDRFLPLIKGRLGLGTNPVISGLKLVKFDLCTLAMSKGDLPKDQNGATGYAGVPHSEGTWFIEQPLVIENTSGMLPEEVVAFCVDSYAKKLAEYSLNKYVAPASPISAVDMQAQLDTLCKAA